jgi:hypothetical protein
MTKKEGFTERGKFASGHKHGKGRPPLRDVSEFRRKAQAEWRRWIKLFSDGQGLKAIPPDAESLLRTARTLRMRLMELERVEIPTDNQIRLTSQLASALGRLLRQVDKIMGLEE